MKADSSLPKIGITQGDINGIGYEVILKTLAEPHIIEICVPVLYGSKSLVDQYAALLGIEAPDFKEIDNPEEATPGSIYLINVMPGNVEATPGKDTPAGGKAAFASLERAVTDINAGLLDAIVTAPINKANIQSDSFHFPGHTEFLENSVAGGTDKALMILYNDSVRVALVTTHLPLAKISESVTGDTLKEKLRIFNDSLKRDFGIVRPRIAVLSLNPHSGDDGLLGSEEKEVIIPALEQMRSERVDCFGPYAADGFFGHGLFRKFDGVLAMYHDQGLAPFKTLASGGGVNFTAGLKAVRTSPDHGTGFDIAGQGVADEMSFRQAMYEAIDIAARRERYEAMTANPLPKLFQDKRVRGEGFHASPAEGHRNVKPEQRTDNAVKAETELPDNDA